MTSRTTETTVLPEYTTAMSVLTSGGQLADHAETSNDYERNVSDEQANMYVNDPQADEMNHVGYLDPELMDPEETTSTDKREDEWESNRKRKCDQPSQLEWQLEHSQTALKSLKKHLERKTCPKSVQYRARARIRVDEDFKRDNKHLHSKTEQDYVQALIRFHNRCRSSQSAHKSG